MFNASWYQVSQNLKLSSYLNRPQGFCICLELCTLAWEVVFLQFFQMLLNMCQSVFCSFIQALVLHASEYPTVCVHDDAHQQIPFTFLLNKSNTHEHNVDPTQDIPYSMYQNNMPFGIERLHWYLSYYRPQRCEYQGIMHLRLL